MIWWGVRSGVPRPVLQGEENLYWVRVGQVSASSRYYSTFNEMTDINKLEMSFKIKKGGIIMGQNGQIPRFAKIGSVLSLFKKYLAIYHLLKIRLYETRVSHCIF